MFVVDPNVLLNAADRDADEHPKCRLLVERWREQSSPWYLTWGIVYEFLRVATHPRVFRNPFSLDEAWSFGNAVLASPTAGLLVETERHLQVASEVFDQMPELRGNLVFDAHTAILMREHGINTIYTRDSDFNRFAFLEVVDPITGSRRRSLS